MAAECLSPGFVQRSVERRGRCHTPVRGDSPWAGSPQTTPQRGRGRSPAPRMVERKTGKRRAMTPDRQINSSPAASVARGAEGPLWFAQTAQPSSAHSTPRHSESRRRAEPPDWFTRGGSAGRTEGSRERDEARRAARDHANERQFALHVQHDLRRKAMLAEGAAAGKRGQGRARELTHHYGNLWFADVPTSPVGSRRSSPVPDSPARGRRPASPAGHRTPRRRAASPATFAAGRESAAAARNEAVVTRTPVCRATPSALSEADKENNWPASACVHESPRKQAPAKPTRTPVSTLQGQVPSPAQPTGLGSPLPSGGVSLLDVCSTQPCLQERRRQNADVMRQRVRQQMEDSLRQRQQERERVAARNIVQQQEAEREARRVHADARRRMAEELSASSAAPEPTPLRSGARLRDAEGMTLREVVAADERRRDDAQLRRLSLRREWEAAVRDREQQRQLSDVARIEAAAEMARSVSMHRMQQDEERHRRVMQHRQLQQELRQQAAEAHRHEW
eukprot:TRINITY_DN35997_c0_g1_i1.p1 TRINITY_DN35997_c0_g1~~TRINITY_DN35997_c0_g1_i1.p1  ORF type:complete len:527 (+),score=143.30 TRINITY_DN35997_c0_g1_i1:56-1582(+)